MEINKDIFDNTVDFHGVMGLVYVGEKIIVYRRDGHVKNFPLQIDILGGGRENNESPFETFKREVNEEVGLDINKEDVVYAKQYKSIVDKNLPMYFIVVKSLNFKEENIKFGNEGLNYLLMSPEDFVGLDDGVKVQQQRTKEYLLCKI